MVELRVVVPLARVRFSLATFVQIMGVEIVVAGVGFRYIPDVVRVSGPAHFDEWAIPSGHPITKKRGKSLGFFVFFGEKILCLQTI